MIKIKEIKPDQRNTNKHTQTGMALLEKSVEKVGVIESYTISSDDVIISGNARHEILGRKFNKEPIVVEIEGDQPVVIKRMDIKSGTKMFHEASILANTTAHKNFNLDTDLIEVIAEEFDIDVVEVGVEVMEYENQPDYSILDDDNEDLKKQAEQMSDGVKKAIQIEFEAEHYQEAYELVKFWREQKLYVGGFLMEKLKEEKEKL